MVFYRPLHQRIFLFVKVELTDMTGCADNRFGRKILSPKEQSHHPPTPTLTPTGLGFVREDESIQLLGTNIMDKEECTGTKIQDKEKCTECRIIPKTTALHPSNKSAQLLGTNILKKIQILNTKLYKKNLMLRKIPKMDVSKLGKKFLRKYHAPKKQKKMIHHLHLHPQVWDLSERTNPSNSWEPKFWTRMNVLQKKSGQGKICSDKSQKWICPNFEKKFYECTMHPKTRKNWNNFREKGP